MSQQASPPESATPHSRLAHLPIALFAIVMGLAGFTLALRQAEALLGLSHNASLIFTALTASVFVVIATAYLLKWIRHPESVRAEFNHPIRLSFFPASSIGLILLSILLVHELTPAARVLWFAGIAIQLLFTLVILSNWMHHEKFEIQHSNPAWFIPIVGNILVPISGVPLGFSALSWFFFSIGLVFWLILFTILMNRYFFHGPMPGKLMPTLFILIAPPAVGFISWTALHPGQPLDDFGHILYSIALFITLLLFFQARRFVTIPFGLPWWAYSFPMAAVTIATMMMYQLTGWNAFLILAPILFGTLTLLMLLLVWNTLKAIRMGKICVPE